MGRRKKGEKSRPLRLPESITKLIQHLALHRGQDPGDYVQERFAVLLEQDRQQMLRELAEPTGAPISKKKP